MTETPLDLMPYIERRWNTKHNPFSSNKYLVVLFILKIVFEEFFNAYAVTIYTFIFVLSNALF